jgi:tetratricopeptide (TPR) repeat protein
LRPWDWRGARAAFGRSIRAGAATRDRQIAYLDVATQFEPADAALHVALAETHYQAWEASGDKERDHALQAARQYLLARSLCPLLPQPYVRLAALAGSLETADSPVAYLRRATRVRPADARVWYLCGRQELIDNDGDAACRCWRQSLVASDKYLADMLQYGAKALTADEWTRDVLPEGPGSLRAADYHGRATVEAAIGRPGDALASYRLALARDSRQAAWRLEMVELLLRQQQLDEAIENLTKVPRESKGYADAQDALSAALEKKSP